MKGSRPIIAIEKDTVDWVFEFIGFAFLLLTLGLSIHYYRQLPDSIPSHFDGSGKVDGYSNKAIIWILPVISIVTFFGMLALIRYPHTFNYPVEINETNAKRQYRLATKMIRTLNAVIIINFLYLSYQMINSALGKGIGLGIYYLPILIVSVVLLLGIYLKNAYQKVPV